MNPKEMERMFTRYKPVARHLAKKYAARTGKPYYDLIDEAEGLLAEIIADWDGRFHYDPAKSKEVSYLYQILNRKLFDLCFRQGCRTKTKNFSVLEPNAGLFEVPARKNKVQEILSMLGEDARILVTTILMAPGDLARDVDLVHLKWGRVAIRSYFVGLQWTPERIDHAWAEVQECL